MELILLIGGLVLLAMVMGDRKRLDILEKKIRSMEGSVVSPKVEGVSPVVERLMVSNEVYVRPVETSSPVYEEPAFILWLKEDWILKLGALLFLIGFGWLTTFAFMNNWIGPAGRITIGIMAGAAILIFGFFRMQKYIHQGEVFLLLGSTTILLTVYAARAMYGFFTPMSALLIMFLTSAFIGMSSVKSKSRYLALAGLILAVIAPFLTNFSSASIVWLFAYLFVVVLGEIWINVLIDARGLNLAALVAVIAYGAPHLLGFTNADLGALLVFAYAFTGVFFITHIIALSKERYSGREIDLLTAGLNALWLLAWIIVAVPDEWASLVIVAWMLVFSVGAYASYKLTNIKDAFFVYSGVSLILLAAATALELQGATLTIAYIIEATLISLGGMLLLKNTRSAEMLGFLLFVPAILSGGSLISPAWAHSIPFEHFFVLLLLGLAFLGLGWAFFVSGRKAEHPTSIGPMFMIIGSVYMYGLLWLSSHAILPKDIATMFSLATYTLIGLGAYVYGRLEGRPNILRYGQVMLVLVVARLLVVDVWSMAVTGRIITFFLIGALLMSTAFIGRSQKNIAKNENY